MSPDADWNNRLTDLNEIFAELYPTIADSRRIVARAGLPASFVKFHDAAIVNWFNILEAAKSRGRVDALVQIAAGEFPAQERLARILNDPRQVTARGDTPTTSVKLTGAQQERLRDALLAAFPTEAALRQMVTHKLSTNLQAIVGTGNLTQQVFELIEWAKLHGRLDELVAGAHATVPQNADLKSFAEDFAQWKAAGGL